jgi:hypothetical protein
MVNNPAAFQVCTIAKTPRLPENRIGWVAILEQPRCFPGVLFHFISRNKSQR